jgi:hypothetical protein
MIIALEDGLKSCSLVMLAYAYGVSLISMLNCGMVYTLYLSNQVLIKFDQLKC